jgi:hypothetical protein
MITYDLNIIQGDSFATTVPVTDVSGNPLNLNNYQMSGFYRNWFSASGITSLNPSGDGITSGLLYLNIPSTGTAALPVGIGVYDVKFTDSGNNSFRVYGGHVYVSPQVTY